MRVLFPVIKRWVADAGDVSPVAMRRLGWSSQPPGLYYGFEIPGYWRVLRGREGLGPREGPMLVLVVKLLAEERYSGGPKRVPFFISGGLRFAHAGSPDPLLRLQINTNPRFLTPEFLSAIRPALRSFLAHELEHARDEPEAKAELAAGYYVSGNIAGEKEEKFERYLAYLGQRAELLAKTRELVELSKQKRIPVTTAIEDFLDRQATHLANIAYGDPEKLRSIPARIARLRDAYYAIYRARYGRTP